MAGELDTEVLDKPGTCRRTADWLGKLAGGITDVADTVSQQRSASESFWRGTAADAARGELGRHGTNADDLEGAIKKVKSALEIFADEIDTVNRRMADARDTARGAGLVLNGTKILPPKPSPTGSAGRPNGPSGVEEQQQKAFEEAGETVADARRKQEEAHRTLEGQLKDPNETFNTVKTHVMRAVTGGLTAVKTSSDSAAALFEKADAFERNAKEMGRLAKAADHSSDAAKTKVAAMQTRAKGKVANVHGDRTGRLANKVGRGVSNFVAADASKYVKGGSKLADGASSVLRGVPYVGTIATVGSEVTDYATGTDSAGEAAMDAGASLSGAAVGGAAGAAIGSAIFPGVGTVIGGAVGSMAGDFLATTAENVLTGE
ncbi:hypothetical protein DFQ14_1063 [Halopolyspora algeriensis]|uniref:Uncharacterized protein n=1 Tax=Halopolyspora algeriensis TaxID=1500506 RepID=A0A368VPU9_9ACTN|nr:hypothetical protein [Halopolyspora algeriensis]RCW43528.1 hypothetical protein DFQ14_1063 [Halopolyspora algeriensis]TQM46397.1 hypothetical protein FHU43_4073 [Halopolyspora algeriensis]